MILKKQIALAFLIGLVAFTSCESGDDEETTVDHTKDIVGTFNTLYSSESFSSFSTNLEVTKVNDDKVLITPSEESSHPSFEAMVSLTTTNNYGFNVASQTNGDYSIEGLTLEGSEFDGGYIVADSSIIYTILLKSDALTDTVTIFGVKK